MENACQCSLHPSESAFKHKCQRRLLFRVVSASLPHVVGTDSGPVGTSEKLDGPFIKLFPFDLSTVDLPSAH